MGGHAGSGRAMKVLKTEHAGAKNGGGYYGKRVEAKAMSRRKRRRDSARIIRRELAAR